MIEEEEIEASPAEQLPTEVMRKILSCLSPRVTEFFFFYVIVDSVQGYGGGGGGREGS